MHLIYFNTIAQTERWKTDSEEGIMWMTQKNLVLDRLLTIPILILLDTEAIDFHGILSFHFFN